MSVPLDNPWSAGESDDYWSYCQTCGEDYDEDGDCLCTREVE